VRATGVHPRGLGGSDGSNRRLHGNIAGWQHTGRFVRLGRKILEAQGGAGRDVVGHDVIAPSRSLLLFWFGIHLPQPNDLYGALTGAVERQRAADLGNATPPTIPVRLGEAFSAPQAVAPASGPNVASVAPGRRGRVAGPTPGVWPSSAQPRRSQPRLALGVPLESKENGCARCWS